MTYEEIARSTIYTEYTMPIHQEITDHMLKGFIERAGLKPGDRILDFGCGMGPAWPGMLAAGLDIEAVSPNSEELEYANKQGVLAYEDLDQLCWHSDGEYDAIWARHSVEHVTNPLYTLMCFKDSLKPGGFLYVEVPSPDTVSNHEENQNHYSVMGDRMWKSLFQKAGYSMVDSGEIGLTLEIGPDKYFWYILKKDEAPINPFIG